MQDQQLFTLIRQNNKAAFGKLYERKYWEFLAVAMSVLDDKEEAREALQDVTHKFLEMKDWSEIKDFMAYFKRSIYYYCLNKLHYGKKNDEHILQMIILVPPDQKDDPDVVREEDKKIDDMMKRWELLTERQKEIMRLTYGDKKTYQEVAAILKISKNTVKTHMKNALRFLRGGKLLSVISAISFVLKF